MVHRSQKRFSAQAVLSGILILILVQFGGMVNVSNPIWQNESELPNEVALNSVARIKPAATKPILFDQIHSPEYDSVDADFEWFFDEYGDLCEVMVSGSLTPYKLNQYSALFLMNPYTEFSVEETNSIMEYMKGGGKVFLIGNWVQDATFYMGAGARQLLWHMGFSYYSGELTDSDDNEGLTSRVVLNETNIVDTSITANVSTVFYTRGGILTKTPIGTRYLLQSDTDGTANFDGYPLMTQTRFAQGELVVIMDGGLFSNTSLTTSQGLVPIRSYGDNPQLVANLITWMTTATTPKSCLIEGSNSITSSTFDAAFRDLTNSLYLRYVREEFWEFCDFNSYFNLTSGFLQQYNAIVLTNGIYTYMPGEKTAILEFLENGGKVLLLGEQKPFTGASVLNFAEDLGFEWESNILTDADDYVDSTSFVVLQTDNFADSSLLTGVSEIFFPYGGCFATVPSGFETLIHSDDDTSVNYQNGPIMGTMEIGYGKMLIYLDNAIFYSYNTTIDGENEIWSEYLDNEVLRHNIQAWLQESTHTLTKPIVQAPNGGETISGEMEINWTATTDSYDLSVSYNIYLSADDITWSLIAAGITEESFSFDTLFVEDGDTYKVKVEAMSEDLSSVDISDASFSILNAEDLGFFENFVNTITDSGNWTGLGGAAIIGFILGALILGLVGRKKK